MSVWNLVLMSVDRVIAIRFPLKYNLVTTKHFLAPLVILYLINFLIALPSVFEFSYSYKTRQCTSDFYSDSTVFAHFINGYGLIWFAMAYAIPVPVLFALYGAILSTLRTRIRSTQLAQSRIIINANKQTTKTFIYVTAFFIFSFSFDSWYYLLYTVQACEYVYHSPIQVISVFFTALNSCANPFIYVASMGFVRQALCRCCRTTGNLTNNRQASGSTSTDISVQNK